MTVKPINNSVTMKTEGGFVAVIFPKSVSIETASKTRDGMGGDAMWEALTISNAGNLRMKTLKRVF